MSAANGSSTRATAQAGVLELLERAARGEQIADDVLTPREREVVKLVAEGHSSKEIAQTLVISTKTVERHRSNISEKLGVRGQAGLTRYAIRSGLIEA
ncbi:MAG: response regulator transcription factor [Thermoleophilia bacterium]|nr:response regulator transcription factor [Thermoleophilia bacterium]